MRLATWNISTGKTSRTDKQFDYNADDLGYFVDQLKQVNPDVVCLQEVETGQTDSLAKQLSLQYYFESTISASHIDPEKTIAMSILSKTPLTNVQARCLPYPDFELILPNSRPAKHYDKYALSAKTNGLSVINTFHHPLEFLGEPYEGELGQRYTSQLMDFYARTFENVGIIAGDFSTPKPEVTFAQLLKQFALVPASPLRPTKPSNIGHLDMIFCSSNLIGLQSHVVPTENDHFLVWADIAPRVA